MSGSPSRAACGRVLGLGCIGILRRSETFSYTNVMSDISSSIKDLDEEALMTILATVDGKGKIIKGKALEELLQREYDKGYEAGLDQASFGMAGPDA